MADPLTLSVIGTIALTEGVKFLYTQAGAILKRWRARQDVAQKDEPQHQDDGSLEVDLPEIFDGRLSNPEIDFVAVERLENELRGLRQQLSSYADGIDPVNPTDEDLLTKTDALRQVLEVVFQQRLTFKGEERPSSGPIVEGSVDVEEVLGYAAAVRAGDIVGGHVSGKVRARRVGSTGTIIGVDMKRSL